MDLVTLPEARMQVRTDTTADDAWLSLWITTISDSVMSWLKNEWRAFELLEDSSGEVIVDSAGIPVVALDSAGLPTVRPRVKAAVLVELAMQYRFREGEGKQVDSSAGHGYVLGAGATALLNATRKSTVA